MDVNRKYDMQEARLAQHLARVFGTSNDSKGRGSCLARWNVDGSWGCLGAEVMTVLEASAGVRTLPSTVADTNSVALTGE